MTIDLKRLGPFLLIAGALVVTYGARAGDFMMGIDDYNFRGFDRAAIFDFWMGQDRWAMGVTSLPLGQPIVPMVPVVLGVSLITLAMWRYLRQGLTLGLWAAAIGTSVAVTAPVVIFHTGSRTNALGLGVAFVCASEAVRLSRTRRAPHLLAAVALGAYAISTYQTMALAIGCMLLGHALVSGRARDVLDAVWLPAASGLGGFAFGRLLGLLLSKPANPYLAKAFGSAGDGGDSTSRVVDAARSVLRTLGAGWTYYGLSQPFAGLLFLVAAAGVAISLVRAKQSPRAVRAFALAGLVATPFIVAVIADMPRRSPVFWVPLFAIVIGVAVDSVREWTKARRIVLASAVGLAVLGQAQIANAQYLAGHRQEQMDNFFAERILDAYLATPDRPTTLTAVIAPCSFPEPPLSPGREYFGMGAAGTEMLAYFGVPVVRASRAQWEWAREQFPSMPRYPSPGWFRIENGVLLARCGDNTVEFVPQGTSER